MPKLRDFFCASVKFVCRLLMRGSPLQVAFSQIFRRNGLKIIEVLSFFFLSQKCLHFLFLNLGSRRLLILIFMYGMNMR